MAELNTGEIVSSIGGISMEAVQRGMLGDGVRETTTRCSKLGEVRRATKERRLELPKYTRGVARDNNAVYPFGYF